MTIETSSDRAGLFDYDASTLVHEGIAYKCAFSETDGLTLDKGIEVDGLLEVLMETADTEASGMQTGDQVSIDGFNYALGKIDHIGLGMSIVYVTAL